MFRKNYKYNQKLQIISDQRKQDWLEDSDIINRENHITQLTLINHNQVDLQYILEIQNTVKTLKNIESLEICLDGIKNSSEDDDEYLVQLFSTFQDFNNLKEIIISLNKIQMRSSIIQAIGKLMEGQGQLQYLSLHFKESGIDAKLLEELSSLLQPVKNKLEVLSIDMTSNAINSEGAKYIAQFIQSCQELKLIQLIATRNVISSKGANLLSKAVYFCKNLTHIELDFSYDFTIDRFEILSIGQIFSRCQNLISFSLNLQFHFAEQHLIKLSQYISSYLKKIEIFNLNFSDNSFQISGIEELAKSLVSCTTLQKIDILFKSKLQSDLFMIYYSLNQNGQISSKNVQTLSPASFNQNVIKDEELDLNYSHLGIQDVGLQSLSQTLIQITQLKALSLNFSENHISNKGMIDIHKSLVMDSSQIQKLQIDLSYNYIGLIGIKKFCDFIQSCTNLLEISLSFEKVGLFDNEIFPVSEVIPKLIKLKKVQLNLKENIKLSFNMILQIIQKFKKSHKQLRYLDLQYSCKLRPEDDKYFKFQQQVFKILHKLPRLTLLTNM